MPDIHILVTEDEPAIIEFLKIGLRYENMKVSSVSTGKECIEFVNSNDIDLIILDIMLPDMDGFEVCRRLRLFKSDVPVIMLTVKKDIEDKIKGLNSGADDYITKPFTFDELLARIRAVLRRYGKKKEEIEIREGRISLNKKTRQVYIDKESIYLTPTEFTLLKIFMENPMKVFSRDTLLNMVFPYNYVINTNTIDVHISNLRDKIKDKPPKRIRTIYGIGYAFYPES